MPFCRCLRTKAHEKTGTFPDCGGWEMEESMLGKSDPNVRYCSRRQKVLQKIDERWEEVEVEELEVEEVEVAEGNANAEEGND